MHWIARAAALAAGAAVALLAAAPAQANDSSFLHYLNGHGYTGHYADDAPISNSSALALGHMVCENLHVGRSVEVQEPNYPQWPQFRLIAEAAQHELCP